MTNIFNPNPVNNEETYYCSYGKADFIDQEGLPRTEDKNHEDIIAKIVRNKKPKHFSNTKQYSRFYLKVSPNMELYNPIKLHSTLSDNNTTEFKHINKVCKDSWLFHEVDENLFNRYLLFIKTKNMQTFKDIERQLK